MDGVPTEADITVAVRGLKGGRVERPPVMNEEDMKGWLRETPRKMELVSRRWELVAILVQPTFGDKTPPAELAWGIMVLIPKGKGEYQGIRIVEVACKVSASVVN